jgi:hypothetical protein
VIDWAGISDPLAAESVGHQRHALGAYPHGHFAHEVGPGLGRIRGGEFRVELGVAKLAERDGPHI